MPKGCSYACASFTHITCSLPTAILSSDSLSKLHWIRWPTIETSIDATHLQGIYWLDNKETLKKKSLKLVLDLEVQTS